MKRLKLKSPLCLIILAVCMGTGCNPTYQSIRAYVPQHTGAKQLQIEAGPAQVDASYSINDQISVNVGGVFQKNETKIEEEINGDKIEGTETSELMGTHFGVGYFKPLGTDEGTVFSLNAGAAIQTWQFDRSNPDLLGTVGFDSFEAGVMNPYAQVAFSHGSPESNSVVGLRYEQPTFDFTDAQPATLKAKGEPKLVNLIVQGKYLLFKGISLFSHFIYRHNLDTEHFGIDVTDDPYSISSWNIYFGLGYSIGFESKDKPEEQATAE